MIQAVESVRREIVVPVSAERAFAVFTADMTSWWPSDHHIGSAPIEEIVIEPHEGGRWYTRHTDGSETSTGHVVAWEPAERLVITLLTTDVFAGAFPPPAIIQDVPTGVYAALTD